MLDTVISKIKSTFTPSKKGPSIHCTGCGADIAADEYRNNYMICPACGKYGRISARDRIDMIVDPGTFREMFTGYESRDFMQFPGYADKLKKASETTGEKEAVVCGCAKIGGENCAIFVMDPRFIMASMGSVVGEKITLTFEAAINAGFPVIGFTASGGARMQEGIISLMQMAKVSGAVSKLSDAGLAYITVLTDPTTGGVTASFAMQGDVLLSEPGALIGFAGRRVIEQTTKSELPDNFQRAEFLLEHGFIDNIVTRDKMRDTLADLLKMYKRAGGTDNNKTEGEHITE